MQQKEWPTGPNRFAKKKKKDLDVQEIKKSLHGEGKKVTHDQLFGRRKSVDRGWGPPDAVGWGVLGTHGHHEKDVGAQVVRKPASKLIRNEKGLWVRAPATVQISSPALNESDATVAVSKSQLTGITETNRRDGGKATSLNSDYGDAVKDDAAYHDGGAITDPGNRHNCTKERAEGSNNADSSDPEFLLDNYRQAADTRRLCADDRKHHYRNAEAYQEGRHRQEAEGRVYRSEREWDKSRSISRSRYGHCNRSPSALKDRRLSTDTSAQRQHQAHSSKESQNFRNEYDRQRRRRRSQSREKRKGEREMRAGSERSRSDYGSSGGGRRVLRSRSREYGRSERHYDREKSSSKLSVRNITEPCPPTAREIKRTSSSRSLSRSLSSSRGARHRHSNSRQ